MHSSPPLESHPVKSYYYITDAQAEWPLDRQDAWLQKFNHATLADISAHEVAPGHYVHSLFMRRTPGKIRRIWIGLNPFPQPSSGQDELRRDYAAARGSRFDLREFHERVMTNGIAPWWAHRQLLLPGDTSAVIE